ncbi:hypothetical protein C4587_02530 [Candidatus Parcubacteria bacterium]|nr:MAG: hypothetical protein C4587_02530 [Candidatus Parcubacteria bacterium]
MKKIENLMDGELKRIYDEDQKDRSEKLWEKDNQLMMARDTARLKRILELVERGQLKTPADSLHAAMVLQHGTETKHYELAHELARNAADQGYVAEKDEVDPLWLAAAAKDRSLMSQGKPQLYGTQIKKDSKNGPWYLHPVDPSVTDEERARFHVRTLAESWKRIEDLNKREN